MYKIGIFFGTESGMTRLIAKKMARQINKRLGEGVLPNPSISTASSRIR